ncbi:MAG: DUF2911 domain-containing protein [Bacteroidota bacterium]
MRKTFILTLLIGLIWQSAMSQGLTLPRPSQAAEVKQRIGLTDITVNYSRPSVIVGNNDRTGQIWGNLVPWGLAPNNFGNQQPMPWRAGANENTTIDFTTDVMIEGKKLVAGKYGLHMIPYKDGKVTVIFSTNTSSWGSFWYNQDEDALRVDVQSKKSPFTNVLTYEFTTFGNNEGTLSLLWDDKEIPIRIGVGQETILQSFRDQLRGGGGFGWQAPFSAANYCLNNGINFEEAVTWADRAVNLNKNGQTMGLKAALLFQMGKNDEAIQVADEAVDLSNEAQLNNLGYQMMGIKKYDKAEEYFKLNIKKNPKSANVYDSMGEYYMAVNKNSDAIKMFKKSLANNPPAFVKQNSIAQLKTLGVEVAE